MEEEERHEVLIQQKKEEKTLQLLLKLENQFHDHYKLMQTELELQKELTDRLWLLSQRYIILISTGPCCKYPDIYAAPAEDVIISEYYDKWKLMNVSNCRIMKSIHELRITCLAFDKGCSELDFTADRPLIKGDAFHKPLHFFMELFSDLFKCFHAMVLKLKCCLHQTDPSECTGLEEYKKLLNISDEFDDYFRLNMTYCKCLRLKQPCPKKSERDKNLYKHNCVE